MENKFFDYGEHGIGLNPFWIREQMLGDYSEVIIIKHCLKDGIDCWKFYCDKEKFVYVPTFEYNGQFTLGGF